MVTSSIKALISDIRKAFRNHAYEKTPDGIVLPAAKVALGGIFHSMVLRHETVQEAIEENDPHKESFARLLALYEGRGGSLDRYIPIETASDSNIIPDAGINFILNLVCGATSKTTTWYQGLIAQNSAPNSTWGAGWAGSVAHMANEFPDYLASGGDGNFYTGSGRKAATFGVASGKSIVTSSPSIFTMGTGTTDATIYGSTLNSRSEVNWDGATGYLLSGTLFTTPKSGLGASDVLSVNYELRASST